jgi:hypothetical protein
MFLNNRAIAIVTDDEFKGVSCKRQKDKKLLQLPIIKNKVPPSSKVVPVPHSQSGSGETSLLPTLLPPKDTSVILMSWLGSA